MYVQYHRLYSLYIFLYSRIYLLCDFGLSLVACQCKPSKPSQNPAREIHGKLSKTLGHNSSPPNQNRTNNAKLVRAPLISMGAGKLGSKKCAKVKGVGPKSHPKLQKPISSEITPKPKSIKIPRLRRAGKQRQKKKRNQRVIRTRTKPKPNNQQSKWLFWILLCRRGVHVLAARRPLLRASSKNEDRKRKQRQDRRSFATVLVQDCCCSGCSTAAAAAADPETGSSRSSGVSNRVIVILSPARCRRRGQTRKLGMNLSGS